jgi:hypothetical protein
MFYQFNKRLSENIPTFDTKWDAEIAVPAFEAKLTLLYDKKGSALQEAEAVCYAE